MTDDPGSPDKGETDDGGRTVTDADETGWVTPDEREGIASTEAYEQDDLVVLYDAENPLAWVEADTAVRIQRMV
jgi:hypothetical protein